MKATAVVCLLVLFAFPAFAQRAGPFIINSSTSPCATIGIASDRSSTVTIDVSGTFSATLQPSVAMAGQAAHNVQVTPTTSQTPQSTITAAGGFQALQISGWELFQVCVTSYVSGTATIYLSISTGTVGQLGGGGSGGGDTITSPNSTLAVGGSAAATTLDVNGSAGKIMAGATPALTATPTLGLSGTTGSLTVVNTNGTTSNAITENTTGLTLGTITSGTWNGSLISSVFGGTGVNNGSATITLGSASLNFATLGTGIVKNTTTTGALTDAASADVYGLFTSCTGSSGLFLKDGGTCAAPAGAGTVTVVGAGTLTNTALVTGGGTQSLQTPSATSTLDTSGNLAVAAGGSLGSADTGTPKLTFATNKMTANQPLVLGTASNQLVTGLTTNLTTSTYPASTGAITLTFPNTSELMVGANSDTTTTHVAHATAVGGIANFAAIAAGDLPTTLTSGTAITNAALITPTLGTPASGTLTNTSGLKESGLVGAGAAATLTEAGAGDVVTRAGVETGNLTSAYVIENTNSTNNNTSIGLIAGAAGTSTGGIGELVFDVSGTGDIVRWYSGGSVAAGVYTVGTLQGNLSATGALTVKSIPSAGAIGGTTPAAATFTTGTFNTSITCTAATCLGSATATTQAAKTNNTTVATTAYVDRPTGLTTGTSITLAAPRQYFVCTSTCTITMPVPAAGDEFCVQNNVAVSTVITFAAIGSSSFYGKTDQSAYGTSGTGTLVSGGAAGDKMCLLGIDATHYNVASFSGTWTAS